MLDFLIYGFTQMSWVLQVVGITAGLAFIWVAADILADRAFKWYEHRHRTKSFNQTIKKRTIK